MKTTLLTVVVFFITLTSFSQSIDLAWSPERKIEKASTELGFVGRVKDHFFTLRREDKIMYLSKTRISDMSKVWEKPIQWNDFKRTNSKDKNLTFHAFKLFKDGFLFFFEDYNSKEDIQHLYAQRITFECQPIGDLVEVGSRIKERRSRDGSFQLVYSPDSTHFAVMINPYYERYASEKFYFKIVTQDLDILTNMEVSLPFRDQDFSVSSVTLAKNRNIYMLARIDIPRKDRKDDEADYYYDLLTIDPAEKGKVKEFELKLDRKYVDQVDLILDRNDNVKCFGLYADMQNNGKRKDGMNGVFYFSLVKNNVENLNLKEFDTKLVEDISGRRRANRKKGLSGTFKLKYFFDKPEGGAMILAEEAFIQVVTTRTTSGTGMTTSSSTHTHYYNNSILAVNIDASGKIVWCAHIPKQQHVVDDDRFSSFHALYVKGKVYMIYNDEKKNATTKEYERTMANPLKAVPVVVTLTDAGKSDKRMLSADQPGKANFLLEPGLSDKISDHEAFFYSIRMGAPCCIIVGARRVKAQRFGLLTIE